MNQSRLRARCVLLILMVCCGNVLAASSSALWQARAAGELAPGERNRILPRAYRSFTLDLAQLRSQLAQAPDEIHLALNSSTLVLELPMPDGNLVKFRVVESPVMADGLAQRFPQIRTYAGAALDSSGASVRLDLTPAGFHAQVLSLSGDSYIDPFQAGDSTHYMVYRGADLNDPARDHQSHSLVGARPQQPMTPLTSAPGHAGSVITTGSSLRTYRIAVAATSGFTGHFGGTVLGGLGAVVSTINRVNGIFERDLAVRLKLVENNDRIIYTVANPGPLPSFPNVPDLLQTTIDQAIGFANYDLGITFFSGVNGSGVLYGNVCGSGKAKAYTGLTDPRIDAFETAAVAHYIGHQFAASHTHNGNVGACFFPELWVADAAMEPGSGSTLMAYTGLCPGQDPQPLSDPYFHGHNLAEIHTFLTQGGPNNGQQSCGVSTDTGNSAPSVSAPAPFLIPERTPFQLTASGSDPDPGGVLRYSWEQTDTGLQGPPSETGDNGTAPLFRSFPATISPTRVFPALIYILERANIPARFLLPGYSTTFAPGEILPNPTTAPRELNFMVTARDGRVGGGGIAQARTKVTAIATAGPFMVGNISGPWTAGSSQVLNWDVAGTELPPLETSQVAIQLSVDGGHHFNTLLASTANDGVETITVPQLSTAEARIRIHAVNGNGISPGNTWFDINDSNFVIASGNSAITLSDRIDLAVQIGSPAAPPAPVLSLSGGTGPYTVIAESYFPNNPDISFPELLVSGNSVLASVRAACTMVAPTLPNFRGHGVIARVIDASGNSGSGLFFIKLSANSKPTLGSYADTTIAAGGSVSVSPSEPVADTNNNLSSMQLDLTTLAGGGTVSINPGTGVVTVHTQPGTLPGAYKLTVRAADSCDAVVIRSLNLNVLGPDTDRLFYNGLEGSP